MEQLFEILFNESWAIRALVASSVVGLTCGLLGCFVVLRNMSLVGDALAHSILPGVVFAFILVGYSALGFFIGSVVASFLTAIGITWLQHNVKTKNDAAIGIVFTAMFSIGVMAISWISRSGGVHLDLKDFLFGNVLGVSNEDLYLTTFIALFVLISILVFYRYLFISTFQPTIAATMGISVSAVHYFLMLLLSFAVVASLQTVGVILVVAMLITPASTAILLSDRLKNVLVISSVLGLISAVLGLVISIAFDTTPGPAMAVTATLIYLLAAVFAPKKGILAKSINRRKVNRRIDLEDVIKQSIKLQDQGKLTFVHLKKKLEFSSSKVKKYVKELVAKGIMTQSSGNTLMLTEKGKLNALKLVRAHRLWESYLVSEVGLNEGQIHDDAEKFEHFLTEEILDEVDMKLGYPTLDPHGAPIPAKEGNPPFALLQVDLGKMIHIAQDQINSSVRNHLWNLGLLPETAIVMSAKNKDHILIKKGGEEFKIDNAIARQINVETDK